MTLQFVKHNDECWHVFEGAIPVELRGDMNDRDGVDGSLGFINFIKDVPVWNGNAIGNANVGVNDDLTAEQLREIADFMESLTTCVKARASA